MAMKTLSIALAAIVLAGCGSKTDPNEKNFGAALNQYFDKKGELCLRLNKWPVDLTEMDIRMSKAMPPGTLGRMSALESAGLVVGTDAEIEGKNFLGKPSGSKYKVKRFQLTDAGQKFYREQEVTSIGLGGAKQEKQGDICYGKKAVDKIVKWEGPIKLGDYQEAGVTYTYKIVGLADWANKPEIRAAFPIVAMEIDGAGKKQTQHGVKLTSQGWEAKGLD